MKTAIISIHQLLYLAVLVWDAFLLYGQMPIDRGDHFALFYGLALAAPPTVGLVASVIRSVCSVKWMAMMDVLIPLCFFSPLVLYFWTGGYLPAVRNQLFVFCISLIAAIFLARVVWRFGNRVNPKPTTRRLI